MGGAWLGKETVTHRTDHPIHLIIKSSAEVTLQWAITQDTNNFKCFAQRSLSTLLFPPFHCHQISNHLPSTITPCLNIHSHTCSLDFCVQIRKLKLFFSSVAHLLSGHTLNFTFKSLLGLESISDGPRNKLSLAGTVSEESCGLYLRVIMLSRQCSAYRIKWRWKCCLWVGMPLPLVKQTLNLGVQCPQHHQGLPNVSKPTYKMLFFPNLCPHFHSILTLFIQLSIFQIFRFFFRNSIF